MNRLWKAIVVAVVCAVATPAFADDVAGPPGSGVTVNVPKGWKVDAAQQGSEGLLLAIAPAHDAGLLFAATEAKNIDASIKVLDGILAKVIKDAQVTKGGKVTVNGMPGVAFKGKGTAVDDGKPVKVMVFIVQPNPTHVLFAIAMVDADKKDTYKAEFDAALNGIRKAK